MNKLFIRFIFSTIVITLTTISMVQSATLEIVTTAFPPYQLHHGDKIEGFATDIINEVLTLSGHRGHITVYPWARAYQIAQTEANTLIYSIAKTPERKKLFKWVGTIVPFNVYMWRLKSRKKDVQPKNLMEAKQYIVGGVFDDIKATYLQKHGFIIGKNLEMVRNDELNAKKLLSGHIDLLPSDELSFKYFLKNANLDISLVDKLFKIPEISNDLYIAASLKTPDSIVSDLKNALVKFKKSKKYQKIEAQYTK